MLWQQQQQSDSLEVEMMKEEKEEVVNVCLFSLHSLSFTPSQTFGSQSNHFHQESEKVLRRRHKGGGS